MSILSAFNGRPAFKRKPDIRSKTVSDFTGGLDLIDNDITMRSSYAKVLQNIVQGGDGSLSIRRGTKLFCDVTGVVTGTLIELVYFNSHILAFTTTGQIAKITSAGVVTAIWNSAIAAALAGSPAGWSGGLAVGSIDSAEFAGKLIVCNGVDKPLIITSALAVSYLCDPATGSNVNTPIGKYVTTVNNYLIIAGIASLPSTLYISSKGTSGVFPGDTAPNDATTYNLGTRVPQNSVTIIGLASFRNRLIVAFEGAIVAVTMGTYDTSTPANHVPTVQDNIIDHGVLNHRTMMTLKNDLVMADVTGWHTASVNSFGNVETTSISEKIDSDYVEDAVGTITNNIRSLSFSYYHKLENSITTLVAEGGGTKSGWTTTFPDAKPKNGAWSTLVGFDTFVSACTTERGRVYLADSTTKLYRLGNNVMAGEDYSGDQMGDYDLVWSVSAFLLTGQRALDGSTVYRVLKDHFSTNIDFDIDAGNIEVYEGIAIEFDWQLPWIDVNQRVLKKRLCYMQADTQGTAAFTMQLFCDNFVLDAETGDYDPAAEMEFIAGGGPGYGNFDQPYGGGRRLKDERAYKIMVDFKILKIRIFGSTTRPLKLIALSILYMIGTYKR